MGRELDRLHRPRSCWQLALTVAVLLGVGLALQLLACRVTGDSASDYYFRRQAVGLVLAVGVLVCLWFFDYTLLLRRKRMPIAAMAALCILPPLFAIFCTHVDYYLTPYQFVSAFLYPYLLLPIPFAALIATMRGSGPSRVFFCGLAASLLSVIPLWFFSPPACLVSGASMLIVLLSAILLGWFRGKRRRNFLAALGAFSVTLALHLPLYLHSALRRLAVFFHADTMPNGIVYQRIRAGELPSSFVGTSYDLLLLEVSQALGRWVFWAAAAGIVLLAALLLRRIFRLRSRTGKLTALAALCPLPLPPLPVLRRHLPAGGRGPGRGTPVGVPHGRPGAGCRGGLRPPRLPARGPEHPPGPRLPAHRVPEKGIDPAALRILRLEGLSTI